MPTLHYACSAGAIRNRPSVKLDPQEQLIADLKDEVHTLRQQVRHLKYELNLSNNRLVEHGRPPSAHPNAASRAPRSASAAAA